MPHIELTVYSKFCLSCVWPDEWAKIQKWAAKNGYNLNVVRTTYHPRRHAKAVSVWGNDEYKAFVVTSNGPVSILELSKKITEDGDLKDDLSRLRRAEEPIRQIGEVVSAEKTKPATKTRRKRSRRRKKVNAD